MSDYIWSPNTNFFPDSGKKRFVILHGTAGGTSAQGIANYFKGTEGGLHPVSSHYIVGQDGVIVQTVLEKDGAWANGVVTNENWLGNPNEYTISIEHVKSSTDNSDSLTPDQQNASFVLIKDICQRNGIGMHDADDNTGVTGHFAIDPVNRSRCPGIYPWDELWTFLQGEPPMPKKKLPDAFIAEAQKSWISLGHTFPGGTPPPLGTGIYQSWLADWAEHGRLYGPPLSFEYSSTRSDGSPIIVQEFTHARCEWDGNPAWYSATGRVN